jgi:hypothetical protein
MHLAIWESKNKQYLLPKYPLSCTLHLAMRINIRSQFQWPSSSYLIYFPYFALLDYQQIYLFLQFCTFEVKGAYLFLFLFDYLIESDLFGS